MLTEDNSAKIADGSDATTALRAFDRVAGNVSEVARLVQDAEALPPKQRRRLLAEATMTVCEHRAAALRQQQPTREADAALVVLDVLRRDFKIGLGALGKLPVLHWADLGVVNVSQVSRAVGHGGVKAALATLRDPAGGDAVAAWEAESERLRESKAQHRQEGQKFADALWMAVTRKDTFSRCKTFMEALRERPHATARRLAYTQAARDELQNLVDVAAGCETRQDQAAADTARDKQLAVLSHLRSQSTLYTTPEEIAESAGVRLQELAAVSGLSQDPNLTNAVADNIQRRTRQILHSGSVEVPSVIHEGWRTAAEIAVEEGCSRESLGERPPQRVATPPPPRSQSPEPGREQRRRTRRHPEASSRHAAAARRRKARKTTKAARRHNRRR